MNTQLIDEGEKSYNDMNMSLSLYGCKYRALRKKWNGKNVIFESRL
jgi:hypothetical protein